MFLVCGEALFDFFCEPHRYAQASRLGYEAVAGGSPFNVAVGLARLGVPSALLAGVSQDFLGQRLRAVLTGEGVNEHYLHDFDAPTTLAMVAVGADGTPQYSFRGQGCADRLLTLAHLPTLDDSVRGVHFGSFSLVVEPVGSTLLALARREHDQRLISLDPNVRLNPAPDIGLWRRRIGEFAGLAHLIKVSDEDLALLYPDQDASAIANQWLGERCQVVFVTRGAEGASVYSRQHGHLQVPAQAVQMADTVGAGDTFQAALLTWLHEQDLASAQGLESLGREQLLQLLHFATAAAALTCTQVGPDLPYRRQLP
ncbi:carbohydrate kinase family protein [Pseudomonas sp.]|uniref:carbohydrate kinase family protein n=1 Tax=Pseudomonas sp. TaxID=306 RepID=UPI003CC612D9